MNKDKDCDNCSHGPSGKCAEVLCSDHEKNWVLTAWNPLWEKKKMNEPKPKEKDGMDKRQGKITR